MEKLIPLVVIADLHPVVTGAVGKLLGMAIPWILFVFLLSILATFLKKYLSGVGAPKDFPYQKVDKLFTPAERSFLGVLEQVLGDDFRVFGKVRLADIIKTKKGMSASARQTAFNRIQSKHVDFVVCDPDDLSIQFVIELDDSSHAKPSRQSRDKFVDQALEAAEVPLFRFPVKKSYTLEEIHTELFGEEDPSTTDSADVHG